ncbi:MAG: peptidoglycan-binding protein [Clostridia bacterium]|nr:peptidoglycan-binding protein [Clostridia bacterium]
MKQRTFKLMLLALLLIALCCTLSGCIKDPSNNNGITVDATWKTYTNAPTPGLNTNTVIVVTPTPDTGAQPWGDPDPQVTDAFIGAATPYMPITPTPAASPTPTLGTGVLKRGSQGDAVANVQAALKRLGYFEGKTDGDFGEYTENAVKRFQAQNGLTADGIVGQATLNKLSSSSAATYRPTGAPGTPTPKPTSKPVTENTYLSNGNSGTKVTQMQSRLIELGYLEGSASGKFCDITEMAIKSFQTRSSLDNDGIAGPTTLNKLYSSSARKANTAVGVIGVSLKLGDANDAVRLLQSKLKAYGFYRGTVDGSFGTGTQDAVKAFQRANGLTADGKAGATTLNRLFTGTVNTSSSSSGNASSNQKPTAKPAATPTPNGYVRVTAAPNGQYFTLQKGMMGEPVKKLQRALKNAGYYNGTIDGYYGEGTIEAVKKFQTAKGLKADGKAGPATLRYLYEGDYPDLA